MKSNHIALTVSDIDTYYQKLQNTEAILISKPHTIENFDPRIDGKRFFYFRDPDQNLIEIFQPGKNIYSK